MRFSLDKQLVFTDSFHFLNGSLDNLVRKLGKNDFHFVSQELNANILDLVKQKDFIPINEPLVLKKLKVCLAKINFIVHWLVTELVIKVMNMLLKFGKDLEIKNMKYYHDLYLKHDVLKLINVFENFRNESINSFELDPDHFWSTVGYNWDAVLKFTGVN